MVNFGGDRDHRMHKKRGKMVISGNCGAFKLE